LVLGRLPIEISTRGAKFAEGADQTAELNEKLMWELKQRVDEMDRARERRKRALIEDYG
jgi:hypothetical protein